MKRYTFKVYPKGLGREVYRVFTFSGESTLDSLCIEILGQFDFIYEHLYAFCMDNSPYSGNEDMHFEYQNELGETETDIPVKKLRLAKGQKFTLHYDYGDDWLFVISTQKIEDVEEEEPPKLLKSKGEVEQYPDWDDEEWDEEE